MKILVINAGSSSLKYQLLDPTPTNCWPWGLCERIGIDGKFTYKPQCWRASRCWTPVDVAMPTHSGVPLKAVMDAPVDGGQRRECLHE